MFEILKALMALKAACAEQDEKGDDHWFDWTILPADGPSMPEAMMKVEIALTEQDIEFIEQFRTLVGA